MSLQIQCSGSQAWVLWNSHNKCGYICVCIIFIFKGFQTIIFIFIVISTFRAICPPAFKCLSNLGTMSFIESSGVACSDSISHNQVQVLSIPVLLLACSQE